MEEKYKLYKGDCLEIMKDIPDESIDLVLIDPPYLMSYKTNRRKDKNHDFCNEILGDNDKDLINNIFPELFRVLKNNSALYIFCNSNKIDFFKIIVEKYFKLKNIIVWVKNNWTAGDLKAAYGKQYEFIILANKGRKLLNGKRLTDVWSGFKKVSGNNQLHQNQKPVALLEQCIIKHSNENQVVLDCFSGSGSTGIACLNTNRKFIGIEKDEKYFEIAKNRIENHEVL
jgi:site-specific DNA-methyltransferase (adenine-specific)